MSSTPWCWCTKLLGWPVLMVAMGGVFWLSGTQRFLRATSARYWGSQFHEFGGWLVNRRSQTSASCPLLTMTPLGTCHVNLPSLI
jgi:hypothetical protein